MGGGGRGVGGGDNRSNFSRRQFFVATLSIWLAKVRFVSVSIRRDLVVVTWFMFEPLTVRVGGAVGMLRFCLEPISVNSVLVTFRESLNVSSASMVPFFYSNNLAFLAYLFVHPPPTLKTKQNGGEREGCHRLFVVFFSPLRRGYGCTHAIQKPCIKLERIYFFLFRVTKVSR